MDSILLSLLSSVNFSEAVTFVIQGYTALNDTPCIKSEYAIHKALYEAETGLRTNLCTVSNVNRDSLTIRREIIPFPETQKPINQQNILRVPMKLSSYREQKLFQAEQCQAPIKRSKRRKQMQV